MPAPRGPNTLVEALTLLNAADIELRDIALRRPSLDDVFLALTSDNTGTPASNGTAIDNAEHSAGDQLPDLPDDADAHPTGGNHRSWVTSHVRTLVVIAICAIAVTGVSLFVLKKDSTSGGNEHPAPSVVQTPTPASAPPAPAASLPAAPPPRAAPPPVAVPTQAPIGTLPTARPQSPAPNPVQSALPIAHAPRTSPAVTVLPSQTPQGSPAGAVSGVQAPLGAPPGPVGPPAPLAPAEVPPPPPADPLQVALSPLLSGLP